jgi:tetratricopeptide (TPR) repeat protein
MSDDHGLMRGFLNLGFLYSKAGQFDSASTYLEKAHHQAKIMNEEPQTGTILMNMAIVNRKIGDVVTAETYAWQAETIFQKFSNLVGLAQVQCVLGLIYIDQQRWSEAMVQLKSSLDAARVLHNRYVEMEALIGFTKYALATGGKDQAAIQLKTLENFIEQHFENKLYNEELQQLRLQLHRL